MPTVSVLTPVHEAADPQYLMELHDCLADQILPDGWDLEWIVQEDGRTGRPLASIPDAPWISKGGGRRGGAAQARNMGLVRARGVLLRCVDSDDLLPDRETIARSIHALNSHPECGWTVAPCLDLHPDGSLLPGPNDPPPGMLPPQMLVNGARRGELPIMGTTMTAWTELVRLVGGWPAIPAFEDAAVLLYCEAVSPGWMQSEPGEIYRKHSDQQTASAAYRDPEETRARQQIVIDRADAIAAAGWRWSPPQKG
ncbi:glycosyltransferase family 2 protein [Streptomyces albus]|uniref:glycosyltransferase family 2 protein n=1 Tax=Streptomyces albus TaxID=1888 RepID=UPI0024E13847|nr:glycosyltransferase [Streptomyces albus]GHJ18880.1 glycosyl transferase [Streptomyces albus]